MDPTCHCAGTKVPITIASSIFYVTRAFIPPADDSNRAGIILLYYDGRRRPSGLRFRCLMHADNVRDLRVCLWSFHNRAVQPA